MTTSTCFLQKIVIVALVSHLTFFSLVFVAPKSIYPQFPLSFSGLEEFLDLRPQNVTTMSTTANNKKEHYELLVVVPGLGGTDKRRLQIVKKSLGAIKKSLEEANFGFRCLVYVYEDSFLPRARQGLQELACDDVVLNPGLWTHHMKRVPTLSSFSSRQLDSSAFASRPITHVAVLIDDIDVSDIDMPDFLRTMTVGNYSMASPSTRRSNHEIPMLQRKECRSHRTDFADILFAVFERDAWKCWQESIDVDINPMGWGFDLTFHKLCNATVGVIDTALFLHLKHGRKGATYNWGPAFQGMWRWIQHVQNDVTDQKAADRFKKYTSQEKVKSFPRCDLKKE